LSKKKLSGFASDASEEDAKREKDEANGDLLSQVGLGGLSLSEIQAQQELILMGLKTKSALPASGKKPAEKTPKGKVSVDQSSDSDEAPASAVGARRAQKKADRVEREAKVDGDVELHDSRGTSKGKGQFNGKDMMLHLNRKDSVSSKPSDEAFKQLAANEQTTRAAFAICRTTLTSIEEPAVDGFLTPIQAMVIAAGSGLPSVAALSHHDNIVREAVLALSSSRNNKELRRSLLQLVLRLDDETA
jgi:hypothetical protein